MLNLIFNALKKSVQKQANLPNSTLVIEYWKQSDFEILSKKINESLESTNFITENTKRTLGTTISVSTLERIFKYGYNLESSPDKRKIKTLDKLCIFIGYKNWESFCTSFQNHHLDKSKLNIFIKNALQAEFTAYLKLPIIDEALLSEYFFKDGSAFLRIRSMLDRVNKKQWILTNELNPSTFELISLNIKKQNAQTIHLETEEYWYLRWFDPQSEEYTYIYNQLNTQFYILENSSKGWKIKLNYYNNDAGKYIEKDDSSIKNIGEREEGE